MQELLPQELQLNTSRVFMEVVTVVGDYTPRRRYETQGELSILV
jgi:hypothetical protein